MHAVLRFLAENEIWIYLVVGLASLIVLRWILVSWREWRNSFFGLEREIVQRRMAIRLTLFVLMMALIVGEFAIVSFVVPSLPQMNQLSTPTLDVVSTATPTLAGGATALPAASPVAQTSTPGIPEEDGCEAGKIEWIYPQPGEVLSGTVELKGTVNIPNLGFYKYEYTQPGSDQWITIAAGNTPLVEGTVGFWNTGQLPAGEYRLRLVVVDNANTFFPACAVTVSVSNP